MGRTIYRVIWKFSCYDYHDFCYKWQAKKFLKEHPGGYWELKAIVLGRGHPQAL